MKANNKKRTNIIVFIIWIILVFFTVKAQSQTGFAQTKAAVLSVLVDPNASIKEKSLNAGLELFYVENKIYIHTGLQFFPKLQGTYTDWTTGGGLAFKVGNLDNTRLYAGPRLGFIKREKYIYPTWGLESGFDYTINNRLVIGVRSTYDYRSDFKYSGADPNWVFSGFMKLGIQLN